MINGMLLDYKIQQKFQVMNKLNDAEVTRQYPDGIRPYELAVLCGLPEPTVRRILNKYLKEGKVMRERITRNWSLFKSCNNND